MVHSVQIGLLAHRDMAGVLLAEKRDTLLEMCKKWYTEIIKKIRTLANQAVDLGFELRVMLHGNRRHTYRILFTIDDQTVNVLRIRHAAQDSLTEDDF